MRRLSREEVISRAIEVHGAKYDYSKVEYNTINDRITIICPEHGEFQQIANNHINNGYGCNQCGHAETGRKRRITDEAWISRFEKIHGDTYDYSEFESQGAELKSKIICKVHGLFLQSPITHSKGVGCPDCGRDKAALQRRLSQDDVLDRFKEVHGETYDYSLVEYVVSQENVTIICKKHGAFEQLPPVHLNGAGCPDCSRIRSGLKRRITIDEAFERFREVHGERYDYSNFVYKGEKTNSTIICRKHGSFEQTPGSHWAGSGCRKCVGKDQTTDEMIEQFRDTHGDRYDYSEFIYRGNKVHSTIICNEHGPFEQVPHAHRSGQGCPDCGKFTLQTIAEGRRLSNEEILEKFREVHGGTYDYSQVEYTGTQSNVTIVCEKHGPFEQAPNNHLAGQGCSVCGRITLSEKRTLNLEQAIERFQKVHGETYDYSQVVYTGNRFNVTILCEEHGPFEQTPNNHRAGQGCPDCATLGFRNNQPGYYYCLAILGHGGHWWYKGGISGDPQRRAGQIQSSLRETGLELDVELVDSIRFEKGVDARNLENKLLGAEDIRTFTIERFDGSRELFSHNPIEFARSRGWV